MTPPQDHASHPHHDALPALPPRPESGHKGTFGTVAVLGGQATAPRIMLGGPAFTAAAALRVGAGLAVLAMPRPLIAHGLTITPSAIGLALPVNRKNELLPSKVAELLDAHLASFSCLAVGPGLGAEEAHQQIVVRLIAQDDVPLVIDADALNALAKLPRFDHDLRAPSVLTPHPGEYKRLATALQLDEQDADPIDPAKRSVAAELLARRLGSVIVLKGRETVISDGMQTFVNSTGNVALATAGTGDVLTGVIAGLIAQFSKPYLGMTSRQITPKQQGGLSLLECARIGVHVHGRAADLWSAKHGIAGMLASDLLEALPDAMRELRSEGIKGSRDQGIE